MPTMTMTPHTETDHPRAEGVVRERALLAENGLDASERRVPSEEEMEAWWENLEAQGDLN